VICDRWQVVSLPYPFTARPAKKRRPALVVSGKDFNGTAGHTVMAMITAMGAKRWPSDHPIANPFDAGVRPGCYIRWKLFTLPNELILKIIGELAGPDRETLKIRGRSVFLT
jgi:mRNA interferase MazF